MSSSRRLKDSLGQEEVEIAIFVVLIVFQYQLTAHQRPKHSLSATLKAHTIAIAGLFLLFLLGRSWLMLVNELVPDPYLDEFFHAPQAILFCDGRYAEWDDKITTPPGLYGLSVLQHTLWRQATCTIASLRRINLTGILLVAYFTSQCRQLLERTPATSSNRSHSSYLSLFTYQTSINVALFPVLFFFSALYYTDIFSAVVVLAAYQNQLSRLSKINPSLFDDIWTIILGTFALFMRQTNVFWVVVYMGGLEVVHAIKSLNVTSIEHPKFRTLPDILRYYGSRYAVGDIHDPALNTAWPDDWLFCGISVAIAVLNNPLRVFRRIWPHIAVFSLFAGFVFWNGGVVLGDKSNHIATIHAAQMLYLWSFFAFFSVPLLLPTAGYLATSLASAVLTLTQFFVKSGTARSSDAEVTPTQALQESKIMPPAKVQGVGSLFRRAFYTVFLIGAVILASAVVKYNTIIHPFTLADNRHYMFYVFRYTVLRPGWPRFALIPAYGVSAWLVWNRLAGWPSSPENASALARICRPFSAAPTVVVTGAPPPRVSHPPKSVSKTPLSSTSLLVALDDPASTSKIPPTTSTALLWLLTTTLSLITAPLVEPRYLILPWIFWRLLVPAWTTPEVSASSALSNIPFLPALSKMGRRVDLTVCLETLWFLLINLGTMYMFLFRPFYWKGEDGELLDGGRVQRFMW